ncbi:MAG: M15 family metallopeptidase [Nocardioidaceae bacterium]
MPRPHRVWEDGQSFVTGRLASGGAHQRVVLERRTTHGHWHAWQHTRTGKRGGFRFRMEPRRPRDLQLRVRHEIHGRVQLSNVRELDVGNRRVRMHMRRSYRTFGRVVAHGRINTAHAHRRILIQRQRHAHGPWRTIRVAHTRADGTFVRRLPNNLPGNWRVRARWPGNHPKHGTVELSGLELYRVRATLHPVVTRVTRHQLGGSYHAGCPVGPAGLRNVRVTFWAYGGARVKRGTLVVRRSIITDVKRVWGKALRSHFVFHKIFPTSRYGGSDIRSMYHDNTSAFNCRHVTGDPTSLSPHSYGTALDLNTVRNPYMDTHGRWWPRHKGARYRNRSHAHPGMLFRRTPITRMLTRRGFHWGARWYHPDYQHFDPY